MPDRPSDPAAVDEGQTAQVAVRPTMWARLLSIPVAALLAWAFTRQPDESAGTAVFIRTWDPIFGIAAVVLLIVAVHPLAWVGRRSWRLLRTTGIGLLVLALWMLTTVLSLRSWAGPVACPSLPPLLAASLLVIFQAWMLRPRSARS